MNKAPKAPSEVDSSQYNELVGRTVLRAIRVIESRFDMKPEALGIESSAWRNSISQEVMSAFVEEGSSSFYGFIRFEMVARHRRKRVLSASARYLVSYQVAGDCDEKLAELFVARVGRVAAYPYFRVLVATLVSQAGVIMQPLPMISLAPRSLGSAQHLKEL